MNKYKLFFLLAFNLAVLNINAQDFAFSQFYEMPLLRNPAISGIFTGDVRIQAAYRNQWASVTTPYKTTAVSAELKKHVGFGDDYITIGLQLSNDVAGDLNFGVLQLLPAINYMKSVNQGNGYLSAGFMAGLVQSKFDVTKGTWNEQFQNGQFNSDNYAGQSFKSTSISHFDASFGLAFSNTIESSMTNYYVGVGYYHFNKPKSSFLEDDFKLNPRLVFNAGLSTPTGYADNLYVYGDYIRQGGHTQKLLGIMYSHSLDESNDEGDKYAINIGGFYRWADAFIPVVKLEMHKVTLGLSYDINVSKLTIASQAKGGFEITGSYKSFLNMRNTSLYQTKCPRF